MTLFIVLMVIFWGLVSYKWNVKILWKVLGGIPDQNRLSAPQRFMFAKFSGSESTGLGILESEDISTKSLWISLSGGNSLTVWFIYIHIFISQFDDSHLLTMRFMEWTEMDKLPHKLTSTVLLIWWWKLAPAHLCEWEKTAQGGDVSWGAVKVPEHKHKEFIIDEVKM